MAKVTALEARRRDALGDMPGTDHVNLMLLKYRCAASTGTATCLSLGRRQQYCIACLWCLQEVLSWLEFNNTMPEEDTLRTRTINDNMADTGTWTYGPATRVIGGISSACSTRMWKPRSQQARLHRRSPRHKAASARKR